jgi:hypothetical protein
MSNYEEYKELILDMFIRKIDGSLRWKHIRDDLTLYLAVVKLQSTINENSINSKLQDALASLLDDTPPLIFVTKKTHKDVRYALTDEGKQYIENRLSGKNPNLLQSDYVGTYQLGDSYKNFKKKVMENLEEKYEKEIADMYQSFHSMYSKWILHNQLTSKKE